MARLNLEFKDEVYQEFRSHCDRDGRSISDVTRQLILDFNLRKRQELVMRLEIGTSSIGEEI